MSNELKEEKTEMGADWQLVSDRRREGGKVENTAIVG